MCTAQRRSEKKKSGGNLLTNKSTYNSKIVLSSGERGHERWVVIDEQQRVKKIGLRAQNAQDAKTC